MRHGVAFRKLSRDSQHRDMLLRNLVSSLLAHERIQTTFAKAKEAARVAEWVIGWGKSGRLADTQAARKFLLVRLAGALASWLLLFQRECTDFGGHMLALAFWPF